MRGIATVANMTWPHQAPKAVAFSFNMNNAASYVTDLAQEMEQGLIGEIQSVFLDNSVGTQALTFQTIIGGITINHTIAAGAQAYLPALIESGVARFTVLAPATGNYFVAVVLFNIAMPYLVWQS